MYTAAQKYNEIQEVNKFLQLSNTLISRYEKQGRKEVARAVSAATSAAALLRLSLLPVVDCPLHHTPLVSDKELELNACKQCMAQQTCPTCHKTYTNPIEVEYLLRSVQCLGCDDISAEQYE